MCYFFEIIFGVAYGNITRFALMKTFGFPRTFLGSAGKNFPRHPFRPPGAEIKVLQPVAAVLFKITFGVAYGN